MKIMERGQITIPKKLRDRYGLKQHAEVELVPLEEGILIVKRSPKTGAFREVFGILQKNTSSDEYLDDIRGR